MTPTEYSEILLRISLKEFEDDKPRALEDLQSLRISSGSQLKRDALDIAIKQLQSEIANGQD